MHLIITETLLSQRQKRKYMTHPLIKHEISRKQNIKAITQRKYHTPKRSRSDRSPIQKRNL